MQTPPTNRIVALLSGVLLLVMALAPVIANFDWKSTAGIIAGMPAIALVVYKWLEGWQRWESPESFAPSVVAVPAPSRALSPMAAVLGGADPADDDDEVPVPATALAVEATDPGAIPPDEGDGDAAQRRPA
jgi:hypothetical protein